MSFKILVVSSTKTLTRRGLYYSLFACFKPRPCGICDDIVHSLTELLFANLERYRGTCHRNERARKSIEKGKLIYEMNLDEDDTYWLNLMLYQLSPNWRSETLEVWTYEYEVWNSDENT